MVDDVGRSSSWSIVGDDDVPCGRRRFPLWEATTFLVGDDDFPCGRRRPLWETTTFLVGDYERRLFGTLLDSFVKMLSHFFGGLKLSEK